MAGARQGDTTFGGAGAATYRPAGLTALGITPRPAAPAPAAPAAPTYQDQIRRELGLSPTPTPAPAPAAPAQPYRPPALTQPAAGPTWGGWGTAVDFGNFSGKTSGTPNWGSWQTSAPLHSTTNYVNPQTGRNWGTTPRLNMAIAEATGYTGNFDAASWNAYYNSLSPALKAQVDALRASYPGAPAATTPAGTTPAATNPAATNPQYPNAPAPAAPEPFVPGTNVPQGGTNPNLVSGGAAPTATGPNGVGPGTAGGLGGSWINTNATPTTGGMSPDVTNVMPTFTQGGDLRGYSNAAANWGNAANMAAYYPTR